MLLEHIRVASGAHQDDGLIGQLIYQQPAGFDVALPMSNLITVQFMRAASWRQGFSGKKRVRNSAKFFLIFAARHHSPQIAVEFIGRAGAADHYIESR